MSERKGSSSRKGRGDLTFVIGEPGLPDGPPSFNVLYVETPRVGLLQTPEWRGLADTWGDALALVAPLLRFGFPETSLATKCPYYE